MDKLKKVVVFESIVIIVLIVLLFFQYNNLKSQVYQQDNTHLLSPRIYSGILKPESYLILNFEPLRNDLQRYITDNKINAAVYVLNIRNGASIGINEDESFPAASLNKLPVAMVILKKIEKGDLSFDTILSILPQDRQYSSGTLYTKDIKELSVRDLLKYMLQESDNVAFSVLARQSNFEDGRQIAIYLNYYKNYTDYSKPPENYETSPKTVANIFLSLYLSTALQPENSEFILSLLTNTNFNIKAYANLPEKMIVSQKYGSFHYEKSDFFHSCGILYIEDSRAFYCVMTRGLDRERGSEVVGTIVNKIYKYVVEARAANSALKNN